MRNSIVFLAFAAAAPVAVAAVPSPPPVTVAPPATAIDPQRLAIAREIALSLWPNGTAQRMIGPMITARNSMVTEMLKATPRDMGVKTVKDSDRTLADVVHERDPYFEQRMAIRNRIMVEEVGKFMATYEPVLRESLAELYARRFTKSELSDIAAFFRTPSGKTYASQVVLMSSDPQYTQAVAALGPKLMQALPRIVERIKKETAQLPPPKPVGDKAKTALPST